jgi:hypothetical protein
MTEQLDRCDLLDVSHGSGCYALRVDVPSLPTAAKEQWDATHDARPGNDALTRMAQADRVAYVGASSDVYGRLCDHCGEVRKAALLDAFPPTEVVNVWPVDEPFEAEFNRAYRLAQNDWVVWTDGRLLG